MEPRLPISAPLPHPSRMSFCYPVGILGAGQSFLHCEWPSPQSEPCTAAPGTGTMLIPYYSREPCHPCRHATVYSPSTRFATEPCICYQSHMDVKFCMATVSCPCVSKELSIRQILRPYSVCLYIFFFLVY